MVQLELPGISREGHLEEVLEWMINHELECAADTVRMHQAHKRYLVEWFGDVHVRTIRYAELRAYYEHELRRGLARETIRKRFNTLHMGLESAHRREILDKLPPWVVIKSDTRPSQRFWTLQQWEAADAVIDDEELRIWVAVGWWTGMHSSDIDRFRWDDVNLWKKTWVRRCTKNKKRVQPKELPLPARLHKILTERFGRLQPHPRDLVAGRPMGHPNREMKAIAARAGVPAISPKDFRHSCVTFLFESGCDEKFVSEWTGHTTVRMPQNVYRHSTAKTLADNLAAIDAR